MIKRLICLLILAGWGICSAMSTESVALEMNKKGGADAGNYEDVYG